MRLTGFLLLAILGVHQVANADIVFQLSPATQQITQGNSAEFSIFLSSTTPGGDPVNGIDVNVNAGAGNGSGGVFTSSNALLFGGGPFDFSTPGQAFFAGLGTVQTLTATPTLFGTLVLNTAGVAPATYNMSLDFLNAVNFTGSMVTTYPVNAGTNINYTVVSSAIPEPSSLASVAMIGLSVLGLGRRRRNEICRQSIATRS